ncbi:MAG: KH domain-containing protein [Ruminococcaceae bacterium]|nr:KH domain-containing protein [Oscillospiraceae bacterium]
MKQILTDIAKAIVDEPDMVTVIESENGNSVVLTLSVASQDMGKVIGRNGRIAKAIRTVMKAAANADNKKVTVEIR